MHRRPQRRMPDGGVSRAIPRLVRQPRYLRNSGRYVVQRRRRVVLRGGGYGSGFRQRGRRRVLSGQPRKGDTHHAPHRLHLPLRGQHPRPADLFRNGLQQRRHGDALAARISGRLGVLRLYASVVRQPRLRQPHLGTAPRLAVALFRCGFDKILRFPRLYPWIHTFLHRLDADKRHIYNSLYAPTHRGHNAVRR